MSAKEFMKDQEKVNRRQAMVALGVAVVVSPGIALGQAKSDPQSDPCERTTKNKGGTVKEFNVHPGVAPNGDGTTKVYKATPRGVKGDFFGYLVSCPQDCAPPGRDSNIYPTAETMSELVYTKSASDYEPARESLGMSVCNAQDVRGCAHVSSGVTIYNASNSNGKWSKQPATSPQYVLVAYGKLSGGLYVAAEVWLSDGEWQENSSQTMKDVYSDIRHNRGIDQVSDKCTHP